MKEVYSKYEFKKVSDKEIFEKYSYLNYLDVLELYKNRNFLIIICNYDSDYVFDIKTSNIILEYNWEDVELLDEFLYSLSLPKIRQRKLLTLFKKDTPTV